MANVLDTDECRAALRSRFSRGNGFIYLEELQNVGGIPAAKGIRRCDFWAMSVYGSRGFETHGVEIKTSRSDLRSELQDPEKAEGLSEFCDYWWLAVGDREILDGMRIPKAWGALWPRGEKLVQKEEPEHTPSRTEWDRAFCAALVKRCWNPHQENKIRNLKREHEKELREARRKARKSAKEREREKCEELRARVEAFEKASGLDLDAFSFRRYGIDENAGQHLGDAVRILLNGSGKLERHLRKLRQIAKKARDRAGRIESTADGLEEFVEDLEGEQLDLLNRGGEDAE